MTPYAWVSLADSSEQGAYTCFRGVHAWLSNIALHSGCSSVVCCSHVADLRQLNINDAKAWPSLLIPQTSDLPPRGLPFAEAVCGSTLEYLQQLQEITSPLAKVVSTAEHVQTKAGSSWLPP